MTIFRTNTLQQKTALFVLMPTFLLFSVAGFGGFFFAQKSLLMQWSEVANANLQRAAHVIDMRLNRPKDLLQRLQYTSGTGMAHLTLRYTIEQLKKLDGVADVVTGYPVANTTMGFMRDGMHRTSATLEIGSPQYIWKNGTSTVSLVVEITDTTTERSGTIEVKITVSDLVEQIAQSDWWKGNQALVIDEEGNIIAHSSFSRKKTDASARGQFGLDDPLERKTLSVLRQKPHGTVFSDGNPLEKISGFYHLSDAPWYLVVVAPGDTVLQSILKFTFYYGLLFAAAIIVIIWFIRSMTTKMTRSIRKLSLAAEDLANGVFGPPLNVQSGDEIGELTKSFNTMTSQLKQGMALQKSIEIAREVQQNFLPDSSYNDLGIKIYGACRYSQETGGDFFDYVISENMPGKVGMMVGDVVGHGIGAALLMASVRAMVRARNDQPGSLAEVLTDVNRVLCNDTESSSNFVTLFYLMVDRRSAKLEWVRAGHDPAFLLYPERKECRELYGRGVALGVDRDIAFKGNTLEITEEEQIIVIGSDGAWEAENDHGERFGKDRLVDILKKHAEKEPEDIIATINDEIDAFLGAAQPQDDITFVVVKLDGRALTLGYLEKLGNSFEFEEQ